MGTWQERELQLAKVGRKRGRIDEDELAERAALLEFSLELDRTAGRHTPKALAIPQHRGR